MVVYITLCVCDGPEVSNVQNAVRRSLGELSGVFFIASIVIIKPP